MTLNSRKLIDISLCCSLVFCMLLSMCGFSDSCNEMYENIVRIRIIANSDSAADQEVKLKVRDAVLASSEDFFADAEGREDALLIAKCNLDFISEIANNTLLENGFDYGVSARVGSEFFDTRVYEDFTLPAGRYESLVLTLGEGKGENWWCVM
ncbi:MAG: stage II sporulation protein R, partial [Clostridia bacterium]|nr:stage II sporulation protein R [Clostridia bacterium]